MDTATITMYFTQYGVIAIFIIVLLEYLNLPGFPAGVIMPLAGIMAAQGKIQFFWVMVITISAGLLGSLLLYSFSRFGGTIFLNAYTHIFPKQKEAIHKNIEWVKERGTLGIFLAKLIPVIRTIIPIPAGILRMNLAKYIVSSTLGIAVWNFVFIGAGYLFGEEIFDLLETL